MTEPLEPNDQLLVTMHDKMNGELLVAHVIDMAPLALPPGWPVDVTVAALSRQQLEDHPELQGPVGQAALTIGRALATLAEDTAADMAMGDPSGSPRGGNGSPT